MGIRSFLSSLDCRVTAFLIYRPQLFLSFHLCSDAVSGGGLHHVEGPGSDFSDSHLASAVYQMEATCLLFSAFLQGLAYAHFYKWVN